MPKHDEIVSVMLRDFIHKHKLSRGFIATAEQWYMPLAEDLRLHQRGAQKTYYVGINGCQGSGKSTLAGFIQDYLQDIYRLNVVVLSLDDFYLSRAERAAMSAEIHPLFATRGVPGTHNMALAKETLLDLAQNNQQVALSRFNKASDNPLPPEEWPVVHGPVDLVIFEGWCWGVSPQSEEQLLKPVNDLEQKQDELATWRRYANCKLADDYQPLYKMMNYWLMLKAPSFEHVYAWRLEQEQKLHVTTKAATQADGLMSASQVHEFIQYYQRLTEHALRELPTRCDQVFELNEKREIHWPPQGNTHA